ncbi:MAG: choice-of-anchor I family protein, partial [Thermodesulfobacteriota bacterium]
GMTLDKHTPDQLDSLDIKPVFKRKVLNLPSIGYLPSDKAEGVTILPDGRIAVMNDNDFGIEASKGFKPALGLIPLMEGNMLDASDKDSAINIKNWPVLGMYQSDGIDKYSYKGATYYVTANEGDTRDFEFFSEEERVKDLDLDPDEFPDASTLDDDENLGRLKTTNIIGDIDGDNDRIFSFGGRSFSIWDSFGNLVYDSSDDFEFLTADAFPTQFNSNHTDNDSFDSRSDDKGPKPEGVVVGKIGPKAYAFIGLERIGGVMVYDITKPTSPRFVEYVNNRNFDVDAQNPDDSSNPLAGDLGPEGLFFIPSSESPNGKALLVVGNEISGTTTVYEIDN